MQLAPTGSYITHLGTATPEQAITQEEALAFMRAYLQPDARQERLLRTVYNASRIGKRHTVLPDYARTSDWSFFSENGSEMPSTTKRMDVFKREALPLAVQSVKQAGIPVEKLAGVTHLITISCTGLFAPGLDIQLVRELGLSPNVERTAIQFMGCYAVFNGLKVARSLVQADPKARVLLVSVELCTLHFQTDWTTDNLLVNALFADGAGAALIEAEPGPGKNLALENFFCDLAGEGEHDMTWNLGETGFEMTLTSAVPEILRERVRPAMSRFLNGEGPPEAIRQWAVHPGGKRILDALAQSVPLESSQLEASREVLDNYGNMSSATVLFVLERMLEQENLEPHEPILSMAFGPGLTVEAALMRLHHV